MVLIPPTQQLRVQAMTWEANDVVGIVLARDDGADLPQFACGAHVDLVLAPGLIRQYSLCGDPGVRNSWAIAVLREANGRGGSEFVHSELRPGALVDVVGPRNNFPLVAANRYLFIAGGIGITPLRPMIHAAEAEGSDWALLYGGRSAASMAFLAELREFGHRVTITPQDEYGLLDLRAAIEPLPQEAAVYCCGPEPLIAAVEHTCADMGRDVPYVERFSARPDSTASQPIEGDTEFELVLSVSGRRFTVPPGKTIIEVLEDADVYVPTSCTEGFCGTCITEVEEGTPDHRDEYLNADDHATNKSMMICVSRSNSPVLVIKA